MATPTTRRGSPGRFPAAVAAALLLGLAVGTAAGPAAPRVLGSCAAPRGIAEALLLADVAVVGTVTHIENGGRWITVHVEEVWRSPGAVPDPISVHGGPEPGTATAVDRVFGSGRFLFFLTRGPGYFLDTACSATTAWTDDLARFRPAGVSPAPEVATGAPAGPVDPIDIVPVLALGAALVIALVSYGVILRARRRPPDWMR